MAKDVLLIVPTRDRVHKIHEFYPLFVENSSITDLCIAIDDDDSASYPELDGVIYEINPRGRVGMTDKLNLVANKYAHQYKYLAFMGDDHRIRTNQWDKMLVDSISGIINGIAYGNDMYQGDRLPTSVLMDSEIVKTLGFMSPPDMQHLYIDNFWKELGTRLNTLRYSPEVIIEHMHFSIGKSQEDSLYREINSSQMYEKDRIAYDGYMISKLMSDVRKLKNGMV